jgi:hypothetical protein
LKKGSGHASGLGGADEAAVRGVPPGREAPVCVEKSSQFGPEVGIEELLFRRTVYTFKGILFCEKF